MKKLLVLFTAVILASCSQDQVESSKPVAKESSLSVLDGDLLSYKDDASFIKEYSALSELKTTKEVQNWISKKGHSSYLNKIEESNAIQDSIIDTTKIIYSDALKSILNADSKFKVNGKIIWLNENNFYILSAKDNDKNIQELILIKNDLEVYGNLSNGFKSKSNKVKSDVTNRILIPAVNGTTVTYINDGLNSKRYYLIIFNETITLNGVFTSKMYLKSVMQYRSCSFWRCTWKEDTGTYRYLTFDIIIEVPWEQNVPSIGNGNISVIGTQTILLSTLGSGWGALGTNFYMSGSIMTQGFNGYIWSQTF